MAGSPCPQALEKFAELFNAASFFEAHEVLENYWHKDQSRERAFYQGLIQITAACVHLQKGTPEGVQKLLQKARQHLKPYLPAHTAALTLRASCGPPNNA